MIILYNTYLLHHAGWGSSLETKGIGKAVAKAPIQTVPMTAVAMVFVNLGLKGAVMALYLSAAKATRVYADTNTETTWDDWTRPHMILPKGQ